MSNAVVPVFYSARNLCEWRNWLSPSRLPPPACLAEGSIPADPFLTAQIESNYDEVTDSFDAMNLKSELLRGKSSADI